MISAWQILLSAIFILLIWMFNKAKEIYTQLNKKNNKIPDVKVLEKIIPLSNNIGWQVKGVCNGVPIWKYKATFTFAPRNLYGCRALLLGKPETILEQLLNIRTFNTIFSHFPSLKKENDSWKKANSDILSLSNVNTSLSLTSILTSHHKSFTLERCWFQNEKNGWLYMCPTSTLLSAQYGYWIFFSIQELSFDNTCLLHILSTYPKTTSFSYISDHLSSCLVLCRERMDSLCLLKINENIKDPSEIRKTVSPNVPEEKATEKADHPEPPLSEKKKVKKDLGKEAFGVIEEPAIISTTVQNVEAINTEVSDKDSPIKREEDQSTKKSLEAALKPQKNLSKFGYDPKLDEYCKQLMKAYETMLEIYEADESTPNWDSLGTKDAVRILKRDGDEVSASGTYKGTAVVKVPLDYLLHYCHTLEYRNEFDTLFETGYDLVTFDDGVSKINNLLYQNVWPTTGRDFCSITALRHLKDNIYASVVTATTHEECPERNNKVRGEVIIAGYVFKVLSEDPPEVEITYVTRADLKGSIPGRITKRVNAEQPLLAGRIRKHCERRYEIRDPPLDGITILEKIKAVPSIFEEPPQPLEPPLEEKEEITNNEAETDDKILNEDAQSDDVLSTSTPVVERKPTIESVSSSIQTGDTIDGETSNYIMDNGFDLQENFYSKSPDGGGQVELPRPRRMTSEDSLLDGSESIGDLSQVEFTEDQTNVSISEQPLDLPRDSFGKIDYVTLGNQAAALLEEEFIKAKSISSTNHGDMNTSADNWVYQTTSKEVEILRKVHSSSKFHSFLARGFINALPVTVWEAIKNPTTRFVYDNMLKKTTVVKEISDRHRILHMRHETTACFVKQARDFCILTCERVEQQRYSLVATSVEIPECPPVRDCVRGKILSSGWIVEPMMHNGRYCSMVTYVTQVDFGGRLPTRIINFIAKRQPLSLAYLRDFLESSEF
eukprot:TCONS_00004518-protein